MDSDRSVLMLFDPLKSPAKSPPTSPRLRSRDPQSPVTAFFTSVDRSKQLLETVKKKKEPDLIDLGQLRTPLHVATEHVEPEASRPVYPLIDILTTPAPRNANRTIGKPVTTIKGATAQVVDPFSPPPPVMTSHAFPAISRLVHQDRLLQTPDSRGLKAPSSLLDLAVSTNFTPVPPNLPYIPDSSLRSLQSSATSSSTKRRRSSIDLGQELQQGTAADSSFDILTGELELAGSTDVSFVSSANSEAIKGLDSSSLDNIIESPWTMRADAPVSAGRVGSTLQPVLEARESSLLAHEIPLPASSPSSPNCPEDADASMHASKIFTRLRTLSTATVTEASLQFPKSAEESPPSRDIGKFAQFPSAGRKPPGHTRSLSISSAKSASTVRNSSPGKIISSEKTPVASPSRSGRASTSPSKSSSAKRIARFSIASKAPTAKVPGITSRLSMAPRASTAGPGAAPRSSVAPRSSMAPRGSMAPPPPRLAAKPRMSIASVSTRPSPTKGRTSLAVAARRQSIVPAAANTAAPAATSKVVRAAGPVLTSGARANTNTTLRAPRPSMTGTAGTTLKKAASSIGKILPTKVMPSVKGDVSRVTGVPSQAPKEPVSERGITKGLRPPIRPRTSSAGATLMSRARLEEELEKTRPGNGFAAIPRPKSSMSRA